MSPVEFKKMPCRPVEFKGQGPRYCSYSKCLLCTLSDDIINMQILFFVAEIGTSKRKDLIFHVIFF